MQNSGVSVPRVFLTESDDGALVGNFAQQSRLNFYETEWSEWVEKVAFIFREALPRTTDGTKRWFAEHHGRIVFRLLGQNQILPSALHFFSYLKSFTDITAFLSIHSIEVSFCFLIMMKVTW